LDRWRRNLWALWSAQMLAMIAMSAVIPFLPLFIRQLGVASEVEERQWSGLVFAAPFFTSLIASPIWGALADRYSRKAMVLRAVVGISIALILMGLSRSVQELFFWRLVQGGISGFIAAALGFVAAETPPAHRGYAIGVLQTSQSVGAVVGPFLGGVISQYAGMRSVFWVMSALCALSAVVVLLAVEETSTPDRSRKQTLQLRDNLRAAWTIPGFALALGCIVLAQMGTVMPSPQMPFFLEELGVGQQQLQLVTGILVGVTGLSTLVAAPFIGKEVDRRGARTIVRWSAAVATVSLLVQAIAGSVLVLLAARVILGIALSGLVPALNTFVSMRIPEGRQSGMMSLASSAMLLGNLVAPPIGGLLSAHAGIRIVFGVASLCTASILVVLWWVPRRNANRRAV
jgi:DHA1 family multidrug resistance protein-like MFS transporter